MTRKERLERAKHALDLAIREEVKKGGGRESGLTVGKTLQRVKSGVAAANSIRTPVYWHRQILGDWHGDWISCVLCHLDLARHQDGERTAK